MSGHCLSPTVLWAQRKHFVLLRVQVKSLEVSVQEMSAFDFVECSIIRISRLR